MPSTETGRTYHCSIKPSSFNHFLLLKSGSFTVIVIFLLVTVSGTGETAGALYEIPVSFKNWQASRKVEPLTPESYQTLFMNPSDFKEPGYTVNGKLTNHIRMDRYKNKVDWMEPDLVTSELEAWIDWKGKGQTLDQYYAKCFTYYHHEEANIKHYNAKDFYLDEAFMKLKFKTMDLKVGNLIEPLGSGDEVSFLDLLNPRRYRMGLAATSAEQKKAIPMARLNYYLDRDLNFEIHIIPKFFKSEPAELESIWSTELQRTAAVIAAGSNINTYEEERKYSSENYQWHMAMNTNWNDVELKFHAFRLFETLPVIYPSSSEQIRQEYPEHRLAGISGSSKIFDEWLLRWEGAFSRNRAFTAYHAGSLMPVFKSDVMSGLLGVDRTYPGDLYVNYQFLWTHVADFPVKSYAQKYNVEYAGTARMSKSFEKDKYKAEIQALQNFTTGEYITKASATYRPNDMFEYILGGQLNDGQKDRFGVISQFWENRHLFFKTIVHF